MALFYWTRRGRETIAERNSEGEGERDGENVRCLNSLYNDSTSATAEMNTTVS